VIIVSATYMATMGSPKTSPHKRLILNCLNQHTLWSATSRAKVTETMIKAVLYQGAFHRFDLATHQIRVRRGPVSSAVSLPSALLAAGY